MPAIWGDGGFSVPSKLSLKILQPWKFLKGKKEEILVNQWGSGSEASPFPTMCRLMSSLSTSYEFSLDAILFPQFVLEITEEESKEEIW